MSHKSKDLENARKNCSFEPARLTLLLRQGTVAEDAERYARIANFLEKDSIFDLTKIPYLSRADQMQNGLKMTNRLLELAKENEWKPDDTYLALKILDHSLGIELHYLAFIPVITSQGSDEQTAEWLPKAEKHQILGAYLQTELGHGSNVQGLETTATYDPKTEEFVLNSPTPSSSKWWIGALGIIATHGLVQARLILNCNDMGPHIFFCPLRSLKDHSVLPGLEIGEIGPKALGGYNSVDNGWARFNHYRIPRTNMLARFANVTAEGKYIRPPHSKLSYGSMLYIRSNMIGSLADSLGKASTIATRYLLCRRQFGSKGDETQVFKYPSVYMRVIPQITKAIIFANVAKEMANGYQKLLESLTQNNVDPQQLSSLLAETHALSSGLKSYVTAAVVDGIEVCRRSCGGHGFMESAGMGRIYAQTLPSVTYEGDNYILNLQSARAAIKAYKTKLAQPNTPLTPSTNWLSALDERLPLKVDDWSDFSIQIRVLNARAVEVTKLVVQLLDREKKFEQLSWECVGVMKAVIESYVCSVSIEALRQGGLLSDPRLTHVIEQVVRFNNLSNLVVAIPDLLELGIISYEKDRSGKKPSELLREELYQTASQLIPECIGLVDGFGFSDWQLGTEIGRYNGEPYSQLLSRAKADDAVNVGDLYSRQEMFRSWIRPILTRESKL